MWGEGLHGKVIGDRVAPGCFDPVESLKYGRELNLATVIKATEVICHL
ncbi:MAG: hypothetical protein R2867_33330 [Caldilineaceae bacterium]